jgi:MarR family transcriptional regulator, transcriptional regulator for hemolysin
MIPDTSGVAFEPTRLQNGRRIHDLCASVARSAMKRSQSKLTAIGLSTAVASFIRAVGDREDRTLSEVAKALGVETATLSALAVRMERDGLLQREPSPSDKRAMHLHLTPRAHELSRQAEQIIRVEVTDLTHGLSDLEQVQLIQLLSRVSKNLDGSD